MNAPEKLPQWQADRLAALLDALGPIPVSDAERASLAWLCGFEAHTVVHLAGLIQRARSRTSALAARRVPDEMARLEQQLADVRAAVISWGLKADHYREQLIDLCERVGIDPGPDPHAALLAHLRGREPGELADAVAGFLAAWDRADASWRSLDAPVITMRRAHEGRGSS